MKYVRTKNSIREIINDYGNCCSVKSNHRKTIGGFTIIYGLAFAPRADTIEELCDEFVIYQPWTNTYYLGDFESVKANVKQNYYKSVGYENPIVYGAIWTDKGLIYVAKMNEKGVLELL